VNPSFIYDWATGAGTLRASWSSGDSASNRFLSVTQGSTSVAAPLLPAATLSYDVAAGVTVGDTYSAEVRALASGSIGAWSPAMTVIVHQLVAPSITSVTGDATAHTITVDFTAVAGPTGQSFVAELWNGDQSQQIGLPVSVGQSPAVLNNQAITTGNTYSVRVRTTADNSYCRWTAWGSITIGGVPKVTNVAARCDNTSWDVAVSWDPIPSSFTNRQYVVSITGTGVSYSSPQTAATSLTLTKSQTNVQSGQTYAVTVTAYASGYSPGLPSDAVNVTIGSCGGPYTPTGGGDPVDLTRGGFMYANPDLVVGSLVPLRFVTYYGASVPTPSENPLYTGKPLGNRWNHSYNTRLARDSAGATMYVIWGSFSVESFSIPSSVIGAYPNTGGSAGSSLVLGTDLIFTLTVSDRTVYRFDSNGNLLTITDRIGHQTALAYSGGQLSTVTDVATGHALSLRYTGDYLHSVTDDLGRSISFGYDGADLASVTDVMGHARTFHYVGASLMESFVDQRGNTAVKNTYTTGQVTFQQDARALAAGQSYGSTFSYVPGTLDGASIVTTTLVDRAGHTVRYVCLASTGVNLSADYDLGSGNAQIENRTFDGYANLLSETIYVGPRSGYSAGLGNTTSYTYDGNGNVLTVTVPLGGGNAQVTTNVYDGNSNLLTSTFYEGLLSEYAPNLGNVTTFHYNTDNTTQKITDPVGQVTSFVYEPGTVAGLIKTWSDELGNDFQCDYQNTYLHTVTNPFGEKLIGTWDSVGRPSQVQYVAADGTTVLMTTLTTYWDNSLTKSFATWYKDQAQSAQWVRQYTYDNNGNPYQFTDELNNVVTYTNDANNLVTQIAQPQYRQSIRTTQLGYDRDDFLNSRVYSATVSESFTSDMLGRRLSFTDANLNLYGYSQAMVLPTPPTPPFNTRATTTWPALASAPGTTYTDQVTTDPAGRVVRAVDRAGNVTDVAYTTQRDPQTHQITTTVTVTLPPAKDGTRYTTVAVYDPAGRLISFTDENGHGTTYAYSIGTDPVSSTKTRVITATDPLGNQRVTIIDALGRVLGGSMGGGALVRSFAFT